MLEKSSGEKEAGLSGLRCALRTIGRESSAQALLQPLGDLERKGRYLEKSFGRREASMLDKKLADFLAQIRVESGTCQFSLVRGDQLRGPAAA